MRFFMALAPLLLAAGCATPVAQGPRSYGEDAQVNYERAVSDMESGDYESAIARFEHVRSKFPYSSYAALAELRLADTQFRRGRWYEAVDAYRNFIRHNPRHADLDWAWFRVGEAHFRAAPADFFLFPSQSERDQTEVRAARTALVEFLDRFPESRHAPRARELLEESLRILARHELVTARFYASRKHWAAAAGRYETLLRSYPDTGYDAEATFGLVQAAEELETPERARFALQVFLERHPSGADAERARRLLRELGEEQ